MDVTFGWASSIAAAPCCTRAGSAEGRVRGGMKEGSCARQRQEPERASEMERGTLRAVADSRDCLAQAANSRQVAATFAASVRLRCPRTIVLDEFEGQGGAVSRAPCAQGRKGQWGALPRACSLEGARPRGSPPRPLVFLSPHRAVTALPAQPQPALPDSARGRRRRSRRTQAAGEPRSPRPRRRRSWRGGLLQAPCRTRTRRRVS